jgi:class 3 adenylate cyclase/tetratricopeptide (TPR) repeat protein
VDSGGFGVDSGHSAPAELKLSAFVPPRLARDLAEPTHADGWAVQEFEGSVLFVDISGFSSLADRLFRRFGKQGGELLTGMLAEFFGELVAITHRFGGEIVKWSGDAFLAIWRDTDFERRAVEAAAACAHELVRCSYTPDELPSTTLRVRAAVSAGEICAARVGGHGDRWEIVVLGPAFSALKDCLSAVAAGEVALSDEARTRAGALSCRELGEGVNQLTLPPTTVPSPPPQVIEPLAEEELRKLVPPVVLKRLQGDSSVHFAEMRHVSSIFLGIAGLEGSVEKLHEAVRLGQEALARRGGILVQAGADDKGLWILGAFGLPPIESEVRADDVLLAAKEARDAIVSLGLECRGGVASGRAFCGLVGDPTRSEFTFTGRVINLSARLMSGANKGVLCDVVTGERSRGRIRLNELPPQRFSGFEKAMACFELGEATTAETTDSGNLPTLGKEVVGRDDAIEQVSEWISRERKGRERVVVLEGEAGLGKTVFAGQILARLHGKRRLLLATSSRAASATRYGAMRGVFADLLGVPLSLAGDAAAPAAAQFLVSHPELESEAALLNGILSLEFEAPESFAELDGLARAEATRRLLVDLIQQDAEQDRYLLLVEDAHWLDSSSWQLLALLAERVPALPILLTTRPIEAGNDSLARILEAERTERIVLASLQGPSLGRLAASSLGTSEVPEHLSTWLTERADGNPLFAEQLLASLRELGHLEVRAGEVARIASPRELAQLELPVDIESVVTARVDRLDSATQAVLKGASVLGARFTFDQLDELMRPTSTADSVRPAVDALLATRLLTDREGELAFAHDTTMRVAYGLMPGAQRREHHAAVAHSLSAQHSEDPAYYAILAHHWDQTHEDAEAIDQVERAGDYAMRQGAFGEARLQFERAQSRVARLAELGRTLPSLTDSRRAQWAHQLSEANFHLGRVAESCAQGERSLVLRGRTLPAASAAWAGMTLKQLLRQIRIRWFGARQQGADPGVQAMLDTCGRLAEAYVFSNEPAKMVALSLWASNQAPVVGKHGPLARPFAILGMTAGMMRLDKIAAAYFERAHGAAREAEDAFSDMAVLFLEGLYLINFGRFERHHEVCMRGLAIGESLGIEHQIDVFRMGLGLNAWARGKYSRSLRLIDTTISSAGRRNDEQLQGWTRMAKASCLCRLGRWDDALQSLELAAKGLSRLGDRAIQSNSDGLMALVSWRKGDAAASQGYVRECLDFFEEGPAASGMAITGYECVAEAALSAWAQAPDDASRRLVATRSLKQLRAFARMFPIARSTALYFAGRGHWIRGKKGAALGAWHKARREAESLGMPFQHGLAVAALAQHGPQDERAAFQREAERIFSETGAWRPESGRMLPGA